MSSENAEHLTLDEIALKSGFSSQSSFYRVFMKIEGTSPAKYRNSAILENHQLKDYELIANTEDK